MLNALGQFLDSVSLPDGMLRIYLTAGSGAPATPTMRPECYLAWEKTRFPTGAEIERGISLALVENTIARKEWGQKTGNYGAHVSALEEARESGYDEGIVFDSAGRAVSCAMGNLIVWLRTRRGILCCTPPVERGARTGAVLHWVRRQLGKGGLVERDLRRTDLERVLSLAVTNSRLGVMPVRMVCGRIPPQPSLACKLAQEYLSLHDLLRTA
jgi:branched-subunit amino acid aminotransferase/4-amino-4-deoxychorismate lyase